MKDFSCYLISEYGDKNLSFSKDDVVYLYLVRDKLYFLEQVECLMVCVFWHDEC